MKWFGWVAAIGSVVMAVAIAVVAIQGQWNAVMIIRAAFLLPLTAWWGVKEILKARKAEKAKQ